MTAAGNQRNAARWVLALAVRLRQGEALALAWPHVDLDAGTMAIRQSMTRARYAHGCGRLTMNTYSHVAPELSSEAAHLMAGALWDDDQDDACTPRRPSGGR